MAAMEPQDWARLLFGRIHSLIIFTESQEANFLKEEIQF